jgi:hypothetical protein
MLCSRAGIARMPSGEVYISLPGKAQNWVWMHVWLGIASVLLALLLVNVTHIVKP